MSCGSEEARVAPEGGVYAVLAAMAARGEPGALATVIATSRSVPRHSGAKMVVRADGTVVGTVGGGQVEARVVAAAAEVIADGVCRRLTFDLTGEAGVCGGATEIFVEPIATATPLWLFGAGHVGRALLEIGKELPFRFTVVDDRPEFLRGLPAAEALPLAPADLAGRLAPGPRTFAILCSRTHDLDAEYLEAIFAAERRAGVRLAWIGLIGSRAKAAHLARRYAADPRAAARFAEVRVPVGIAIGAETPAEIAVSILAEALAALRGAPWVADAGGRPAGLYLQRTRPSGQPQDRGGDA